MDARGLGAWVLALAFGAVAPALAAAERGSSKAAAASEATVFAAVAKVEIGAAGEIVNVSADPRFDGMIGDAIETWVRSLSFTPAAVDGVRVAGVTHVGMRGCAAPVGNGDYRLAFEYKSHGPGIGQYPPPIYPMDAARAGITGDFDVRLTVQPDGRARLDQVDVTDGGARARKGLGKAIEAWVATLRFEPEQVGGRPVSTTLSVPLEFRLFDTRAQALATEQVERVRSDACQLAFGRERATRRASVALNSPFALKPGT